MIIASSFLQLMVIDLIEKHIKVCIKRQCIKLSGKPDLRTAVCTCCNLVKGFIGDLFRPLNSSNIAFEAKLAHALK